MAVRKHARGEVRQEIVRAAFREFYTHGFQGGSVNRIIKASRTTKGAFFHHFKIKEELGYAVVDEVIGPLMRTRWIQPIAESIDPMADLKTTVRYLVSTDIENGSYLRGCPLNNLAQEMSPLDEGFRSRIDALYNQWRESLAAAIARAMKSGSVQKDVDAHAVAALFVAGQMGIWGTAKSSRRGELMTKSSEALCAYLESLRANKRR